MLRRRLPRAGWWIATNVLAWGVVGLLAAVLYHIRDLFALWMRMKVLVGVLILALLGLIAASGSTKAPSGSRTLIFRPFTVNGTFSASTLGCPCNTRRPMPVFRSTTTRAASGPAAGSATNR